MENEVSENEIKETSEELKPAASTGAKVYKAFGIVLNIVIYIFLAFSVFLLVVSVISKKSDDGAVNIFGYEMRLVTSSSMEKSENSVPVDDYKIKDLKVRSMIFIERVPQNAAEAQQWYSELKVGDVLTFKYEMGIEWITITHRIVDIAPTQTGYIITLKGDNRSENGGEVSEQKIYTSSDDYPTPDEWKNYVLGKVVGNSTFLGYLVYSVKQPIGIALIVIVPCTIIIIWQIIRIFSVINEGRKQKATQEIEQVRLQAQTAEEERENQARELEELKRKIAELENKTPPADGKEKSNDG